MKMTKKFFAIVMTMMLVFTSIPMLSFGAVKFVDPNENLPYAPAVKSAKTAKVKKSKKYSLTMTLESMSSCTGYRLFRIDKNGGEHKVKDFTYKSVKKAKKKIVYKDKKSKVCNQKFVLKSYNTFYRYKKGKNIGWVKTKPSKKYWYKKGADKGACTVESVAQKEQPQEQQQEQQEEQPQEQPAESAPAGGGGNPEISTGGGTGGGTVTPTLQEATLKTTPTKATNLTYTGSAISLLSNPGKAEGGELMYCVTTTSTVPANSNFGSESSAYQKTNAGTYYVWYYVKGDEKHKDSQKVKLGPIIIKKATTDEDDPMSPITTPWK